jgi:hypothetical protein
MYQSPPSVPVWTRREWIAAISTGLLGAAISLGLISLARGDIASGLRGVALGAFQCLAQAWRSSRNRPRQAASAKRQRWPIIILIVMLVLTAGKTGLDLIQGRPMDPIISTVLGVWATIFGPLWIMERHRKRVERGDAAG